MKKGETITRRILAAAFAVAFLVSMLPTQLVAEAAESDGVTITDDGKTPYIGTELTLTAAASGNGSEEIGDYDKVDGSFLKTSDAAGDDTWQDDGEPVTYTEWAWSSENSDVNSEVSTKIADSVSFTVPEMTNAITVTATYTNYLTHTETKVSGTQNSDGKYDVYMRNYTVTTTWTGTYTFTPEYDTVGSITLGSETLSLDLVDNTTATLKATLTGANGGTVDPTATVSWSSSDSDIAIVDDGDVTAVGLGEATITASTGNNVTATCTVTVSNVDRTVDGGDVTLTYGDSETLSVTGRGGKVEWSSNNTSVATVDSDGKVTAVGVGTATVTVTETGTGYTTTTTFAITVTRAKRTVTISGDSVMTYGKSQTLTASNTGSGTVTWASSDENVVKVDASGIVTAVAKGEATVTVTVTESGYEDATATLTVTVNPIELTVVYDDTLIIKESDGTTAVTDDNKDTIDGALSLTGDVVNDDDVSFDITNYGAYSGSGVGNGLTITVTVELGGDAKENYTLSDTTIILDAEITAATPEEADIDLSAGDAELLLSADESGENNESITFASAMNTDGDGAYWFMDGDTLSLVKDSTCTLYTDAACEAAFDGAMTEGESLTQTLYVKTSTGVVYGPITVTYNYDATVPTVSTVVTGDSEGAIDFANDELTYTVTASDDLSGVDGNSIQYYISDSEDEKSNPTWLSATVTENEDGAYSFTVATAASGYLHVKVCDYAGNESEEAISRPLVIESNAPTVTIEVDDSYPVTEAATTHSFTVTATDEVTDADAENDYYSGIASITLTLTGTNSNGEEVEKEVTLSYNTPASYDKLEEDSGVTMKITLPNYFSGVSSGTYTLTVTTTDFCGNTSAEAKVENIIIDTAAPTALTMTNSTAYGNVDGDGTYYYTDKNAGFTVTIDDYTIDQGVTCTIIATDEENHEIPKNGTITIYEKTDITFTAEDLAELSDGTITVTVEVTDAAGNKTEELDCDDDIEASVDKMTFSFVLDSTAPTLDGVELTSGNYYSSDSAVYYNGDFEAVYTITDTNFYNNTDEGVILGSASPTADSTGDNLGDDAELSVEADSGTDTGTVTVSVTSAEDVENSIYQPTVTVTDKAGNALVCAGNCSVTYGNVSVTDGEVALNTKLVLDTLAPKLNSTSSTESSHYFSDDKAVYYNNGFTVTYVVTEVNYDESKAGWSAEQTGDGSDAVLGYNRSSSAGTTTYTADVIYREDVKSASYAPVLTVTDKAGNVLEAADDYEATNDYDNATVSDGTATADNAFVLDTAAPTLDGVKLTKGNYYSSDSAVYYNGSFNAVYSITEANFYNNTDKGVILGSASPTGTGTMGSDATMNIDGTTVTVSVESADDVENSIYQPTVTVTDKAGNKMVLADGYSDTDTTYGDVTMSEGTVALDTKLVLDTLSPKLTSTSSTESDYYYSGDSRVYYNSAFEITYKVTEVNYDSEQDVWKVTQVGDGSDATLTISSATNATYTAKVARKSGVEDAAYTPSLSVTDKAGNVLKKDDDYKASNDYDTVTLSNGTATAKTAFVLDTTAPVFTLSLTNRTDKNPDADSYAFYNTDISATFTVKDANLDSGKTAVATASNTSATTYDTADVTWEKMTLEQSDASYSSNSWKKTLTASSDGVYRFEVAAEDCAGNKLVQSDESSLAAYKTTTSHGSGQFWTSYYLVRDTVAPELEVTMKAGGSTFYNATLRSGGGYTVSQNSPYQPYSSATATLEKTDNSPTSVVYSFSSTTNSQTQSGSAYNHSDLTVNLSGQQIFTISKLQVTDRAGNVSTMSGETNKFYLDTEAPEVDEFAPTVSVAGVTTSAVRGEDGTDLYDRDVTVRAVVVDPDSSVSSSGLYQVYYKVLVNGNDWTGQVSVNSNGGSVSSAGVIGYGTSGSSYNSTAAVNETITSRDTILFTFDADTFNYNDVKIYVWAEDNSGNLLSEADAAYYHFGIDVTDPTITVRYDNNSAQNEKYFNADRIATITVTERNFDPNNTTVSTEAAATISGWRYTAGNRANGDDDTWTCTVTYSVDGDYTFDVTTTDLVGHQAGEPDYGDSVAPTEFTIDKTNPVISVVFDNNNVSNLKYYNAYRTATITIDEHNFSTDGVSVVTTAKLDGIAFSAPTEGAWSSNNDLNSSSVPFTADGDYTMTVTFTDMAGNEAEIVIVDEFTVDTTEPELEVTGIEDETAYSGDVIPVLTYSDINYEEQSATISITGYEHDATTISGTYAEDAKGGTLTCDNLEVTKAMDDVYTATATASDLAGNVATRTIVFSVNRYGSVFVLSDETQELVDQYYANEPQEVHVIEINVNEAETQTVTANINGNVVTLNRNEDYEVEDNGSNWHYYDYYVSADALSTEGYYDITFTSTDTAGNTNSNRAIKGVDEEESDKPVKYVLDMTSPVNIITGVDNNSQYIAATRTLVLQCSDNVALDSVSLYLYVDGECVDTKSGEELWDEDEQAWLYTAEARANWQTVKLVSNDKAGNESTVSEVTFLLTKNLAVQYYNNKPIFFGSLLLLLLILLLVFFILYKRRKEDEDAEGQAAGAAK